jgi:hypothetical protein
LTEQRRAGEGATLEKAATLRKFKLRLAHLQVLDEFGAGMLPAPGYDRGWLPRSAKQRYPRQIAVRSPVVGRQRRWGR